MSNDTPHSAESALDQLEEQQQLFVLEYMKDLNGTSAAIRANYSEKTARQQASRLLSNVNIQNAIAELKAERNERLSIDADYVIKTIVETIERCSQAKQVYDKSGELVMTETPDGELAPAYKYDASNVLKGAELLGKHLGMFTDKVDHTSSDGSMSPQAAPDYSRLSDDELRQYAELESKAASDKSRTSKTQS